MIAVLKVLGGLVLLYVGYIAVAAAWPSRWRMDVAQEWYRAGITRWTHRFRYIGCCIVGVCFGLALLGLGLAGLGFTRRRKA